MRPTSSPTELSAAFTKAATSRGHNMTAAQYFRVTAEILHRAPCRLLLFGAGNDTELHVLANAGGRTLVLEHNPEWLQRIVYLPCERLRVGYSTQIRTGLLEPCPLPEGDLEPVLGEHWDVILVDGPEGYRDHHPGRQQSIFLASRLARAGTTVFLHDAERTVESLCATRYLKPADERHGEDRQLAVFHVAFAIPPAPRGKVADVSRTGAQWQRSDQQEA